MQIIKFNDILNRRASILPVTVVAMFIMVSIAFICIQMLMVENMSATKDQIKMRLYYAAEGALNRCVGEMLTKDNHIKIDSLKTTYKGVGYEYHNDTAHRPKISTSTVLSDTVPSSLYKMKNAVFTNTITLPGLGSCKLDVPSYVKSVDSFHAVEYNIKPYFIISTAYSEKVGKFAPAMETQIGCCVYTVQFTSWTFYGAAPTYPPKEKAADAVEGWVIEKRNVIFFDKVSEILKYGSTK